MQSDPCGTGVTIDRVIKVWVWRNCTLTGETVNTYINSLLRIQMTHKELELFNSSVGKNTSKL